MKPRRRIVLGSGRLVTWMGAYYALPQSSEPGGDAWQDAGYKRGRLVWEEGS